MSVLALLTALMRLSMRLTLSARIDRDDVPHFGGVVV